MSKERGTDLTDKQERVLIHLVENRIQNFNLKDVMDIYDTKDSAKSAIKTLKAHGFIEKKRNNNYELKGIPPALKEYVDMEV